ncbi:hypothetical protein BUM88_18565 [Acinetobacter calcoaceticus]|jgi:asparagine synthetase B (glutamine-hydrolysing)|uniref:7-cyano-7-deazaguanine synthase n=1 Tax=Acinetobacter calcoaceticus TaxID=471 RepID=UPI0009AC4995|nr:7-cyano-7-deazaguanine synthase [Acinetobacter calcoaceticus]AQZ83439.1 hypothetical protein BUM88_18565 [Acinetobacter calcoaceticus]
MYTEINKIEILKNKVINITDYFSIKVIDDEIYVFNSYNSNSFLYVKIRKDNIILTSDLIFESSKSVDLHNTFKYINNVGIGATSIFNKEFEIIPHGYSLRIKDLKKIRISGQTRYKSDPANCLEEVLKKYIKNNRIAISFSGGLDSTSILYACHRIFKDKEIVAFTWWNRGCSNNDLVESEEICNKLGIKLLKIEIEPNDLIKDLNIKKHIIPNYPASYLAFIGFIEKYIKNLNTYFKSEDYCIINGTGGDQIFLEALPLKSVLNFNFLQIKNFCDLNAINYIDILKYISSMKLKKINFNEKNYKEASIYESLSLTSSKYLKNLECCFFYPFSTEEMINCSLNFEAGSTFDDKFYRNHFRKSLLNKYSSYDFYRIGKGSMTGAYQKSIKNNSDLLKKIIINGSLIKNNIINESDFISSFDLSAHGINGVHPKVLLPIIFEKCLISMSIYNDE